MMPSQPAVLFTAAGAVASLAAVAIIVAGQPGGSTHAALAAPPSASAAASAHPSASGMADMPGMSMSAAAPAAAPAASPSATAMPDNNAHDAAMATRTKAFPAKTAGVGAQLLKPTVLADGTKRFELTASDIKWEVEPGKIVDAMAYNGQIPGPTIKVEVGDKVEVVLTNQMAMSTSIHWHGVRVPNSQDGVPDITQAPIKPGETFTYKFTMTEPAVGMYHSHQDGQVQVPAGLAGAFLVGDVALPKDVHVSSVHTMMLNDSGPIGFSLDGKSFPATAPIVVAKGDSFEMHYLNEGMMIHPMHLHGFAQLVVAKDGYPLPMPYRADTINVAPGERYTVVVTADQPGIWAWHCHILAHAETSTGMFGMVTALIVK
ncbi:MAG: multicopper oxidase domain-containing protein [Actinomycetota bacterium]